MGSKRRRVRDLRRYEVAERRRLHKAAAAGLGVPSSCREVRSDPAVLAALAAGMPAVVGYRLDYR